MAQNVFIFYSVWMRIKLHDCAKITLVIMIASVHLRLVLIFKEESPYNSSLYTISLCENIFQCFAQVQ